MAVSLDLLVNAIVAGILLGGFYAAVSVGVTISFGMLDIANIAQPAFILLGCYAAYMTNTLWHVDPIVTGVLMTPLFFVLALGEHAAATGEARIEGVDLTGRIARRRRQEQDAWTRRPREREHEVVE